MATIQLKRGRRRETQVSVITIWETPDGSAALCVSKSTLCRHLPRKHRGRVSDLWRVMVNVAGRFEIVSKHKTRTAAETQLLRVLQQQGDIACIG